MFVLLKTDILDGVNSPSFVANAIAFLMSASSIRSYPRVEIAGTCVVSSSNISLFNFINILWIPLSPLNNKSNEMYAPLMFLKYGNNIP